MTVQYYTKEQKEACCRKYPFLENLIMNVDVEDIFFHERMELPKKQCGCAQGGYDYHFLKTYDFEDENNFYRVIDDNLVIDMDSDVNSVLANDHHFDVYFKPKIKQKRLVVVSGPSGVGKGPAIEWMKKMYFPDIHAGKDCKEFCQVQIHKAEIHDKREKEGLEGLSNDFYEFDCRGAKQRIDFKELDSALENHYVVLLEAYHTTLDRIVERFGNYASIDSVFISPLSDAEMEDIRKEGKTIENYLPDRMFDSLCDRAKLEGRNITIEDSEKLKARALDSVAEMESMRKYRHRIDNGCYESDFRWRMPFLAGEPRRTVESLYRIIKG